MPTVYAQDKRKGAVKIVKTGSRWSVYPLDGVRCKVDRGSYGNPDRYYGCKWTWSKRPAESFSYAPFEARDVTSSPDRLDVNFIKTWTTKVNVVPSTAKKWSKRGSSPGLDIRNAEQLEEIIMKADFKMNAYARAYFNAIREAQDTAYLFGGASPIKGLKVQALYFLTNVKAMTPEQKETKKALLKWAQSR